MDQGPPERRLPLTICDRFKGIPATRQRAVPAQGAAHDQARRVVDRRGRTDDARFAKFESGRSSDFNKHKTLSEAAHNKTTTTTTMLLIGQFQPTQFVHSRGLTQ